MSEKNFTARELQQLKTVDAIIDVCTTYSDALPEVFKFNEKFTLLKTKRNDASTQSVDKNQAQASKSAIITDIDSEKEALAVYVSDSLGLFTQFSQEENNTELQTMLPNLGLHKLKVQKPLNMVTTLQSFVKTARKIDFEVAKLYAIDKDWVDTLDKKVSAYNDMLPKHSSIKQNKPRATIFLKTTIKELMDLKKGMDNLIGGYRIKHPEFHSSYNTAKIINPVPLKNINKKGKKPKKPPVPPIDIPPTN